ncbi:hypothetical protein [Trueperella sp. LYQ143]|uniref:hypothetical protein n=1 Tax=Trueperella sp. LYQ143 TaxID=3391059 RepID=UPI00398363E7
MAQLFFCTPSLTGLNVSPTEENIDNQFDFLLRIGDESYTDGRLTKFVIACGATNVVNKWMFGAVAQMWVHITDDSEPGEGEEVSQWLADLFRENVKQIAEMLWGCCLQGIRSVAGMIDLSTCQPPDMPLTGMTVSFVDLRDEE